MCSSKRVVYKGLVSMASSALAFCLGDSTGTSQSLHRVETFGSLLPYLKSDRLVWFTKLENFLVFISNGICCLQSQTCLWMLAL